MKENKKQPKLGRGLEAIFGGDVNVLIDNIEQNTPKNNYTKVLLKDLHANPYQPRQVFDDELIDELAVSIKKHGVFTPILVKKSVHGYDIISGERRVRASKKAGLIEIDAIIVDFTDEQMMEVALLENIQRENLNIIEEAQAYKQLLDNLKITQEELGERLGKSRTHITNTMRLLQLPNEIQQFVLNGKLTMGHVRPLITLSNSLALKIAKKAINENLSARAVENLVKKLENNNNKTKTPIINNYSYAEELIRNRLGSKVKITNDTLTIKYTNDDDLNRILELMGFIEDDE